MPTQLTISTSPVLWSDKGEPYSPEFDDIYHTHSGAVAQADHVFLKGCGLPQAWRNRSNFTIFETGFGLGLNFLTTYLRWAQDCSRCTNLYFVSVEAHPVKATDIEKALQNQPELKEVGQQLLRAYSCFTEEPYESRLTPFISSICFEPLKICYATFNQLFREKTTSNNTSIQGEAKVHLCLVVGDACAVLPRLKLQADAIFLDGFSPAKNPTLWSKDICQHAMRLMHDDGWLSTWCVAGHVRRNLEAAGFSVQKVAGLPPKRNALVGVKKLKKPLL